MFIVVEIWALKEEHVLCHAQEMPRSRVGTLLRNGVVGVWVGAGGEGLHHAMDGPHWEELKTSENVANGEWGQKLQIFVSANEVLASTSFPTTWWSYIAFLNRVPTSRGSWELKIFFWPYPIKNQNFSCSIFSWSTRQDLSKSTEKQVKLTSGIEKSYFLLRHLFLKRVAILFYCVAIM